MTHDIKNKDEMIEYIENLISGAIYCHGININMIARHLVGNGCRVYVGPRRKKHLEITKKESK